MADPVAPRAVLFDIDGTLVDSNEAHVDAWDAAFQEAGHRVARDAIRAQIGKGGDNLLPALLPDLSDPERERLAARHGALFKADHLARVRAFPHAHDLIARVHGSGARVVLASSASGEELDHYVGLLGIADLIDATTSADDVEASKPAPDIFARALAAADGTAPDRAVAVGDTPYDIEAAGRAGVRTVAVLSGGFPAEALSDAVAVYRDVADLLDRYDGSPLARLP